MSEEGLATRDHANDPLVGTMSGPGVRAPGGRAHRIPKIRGRAQEVAAMTTWRRWQDWVVVGLGVVMFLTPFVFGETGQTVAASTAYVLGVLIALGGLLNAATRQTGGLELIPAVLAGILFVSPWAFGFTAVTGLALAPRIIALPILPPGGSLFPDEHRPPMACIRARG